VVTTKKNRAKNKLCNILEYVIPIMTIIKVLNVFFWYEKFDIYSNFSATWMILIWECFFLAFTFFLVVLLIFNFAKKSKAKCIPNFYIVFPMLNIILVVIQGIIVIYNGFII
jgi:hypothetical protein